MLHSFATRFELKQSELEILKEYLSSGEAVILDQTWRPVPFLNKIDFISDNKEENYKDNNLSNDSDSSDDLDNNYPEEELPLTQTTTLRKPAPHKRRRSKTPEPQDDKDNRLPYTEEATEGSTQARLGRIQKKSKLLYSFEIDIL
jgi:hypothetical protein